MTSPSSAASERVLLKRGVGWGRKADKVELVYRLHLLAPACFCVNKNLIVTLCFFRLYCCRHCYSTESHSWHHGSQNKIILCDDCRIYYKKYGKLPATDESREPPPYMFKVVVESQLRDEEGYLVNGKLALRSRRAIPPVQTTLRSGRNKAASPVEGRPGFHLACLLLCFITMLYKP